MKELKMLCESCAIVDRKYLGKLPIGKFDIQFNPQTDNPFNILSNELVIRLAVKAEEVNHNPATGEFFDNEGISYQYITFPPKFLVKNHTDYINSTKTKDRMKCLIKESKLFEKIGAIGINYDLYVDDNLTEDLKDKILNDNISSQCGVGSITLQFKLNDFATLNLMITKNVKLENLPKSVTLFNANIHISTISLNQIDFINTFADDLYNINTVKEKIDILLK